MDRSGRSHSVARSVAEVYAGHDGCLEDARIEVHISPIPAEIENRIRLDRDFDHHSYNKMYVTRFHKAAVWTSEVMSRFRSGFIGKSSPVQFYWGHFDLSMSRFSGRRCMTALPADPIEREAYSHELFSVGWWAGDSRFEKPAFYAYASPEPSGFPVARVSQPAFYYAPLHGFYLEYDEVRIHSDPEQLVLDFFQSTYDAAATLGAWDRADLERTFEGGMGHGDLQAPAHAR